MYAWDHRRRKAVPEVAAEAGLVVEDAESGFCGAVVGYESGAVVLEDRHGRRRHFPMVAAGFLLDGEPLGESEVRAEKMIGDGAHAVPLRKTRRHDRSDGRPRPRAVRVRLGERERLFGERVERWSPRTGVAVVTDPVGAQAIDQVDRDARSLGRVRREDFVPAESRALAFADIALPIGHGESMMKPVLEGRLLQALAVENCLRLLMPERSPLEELLSQTGFKGAALSPS